MIRYLLIVISLLTLISCSDTDNSEPPAELLEFKQSIHIKELWSNDTGEGVDQLFVKLFPLVVDEHIVAVDRLGLVSAYNLETGNRLWQTDLKTVISGGVGGNSQNLVLTSRNGHVILLDNKGKLLWKVDASSEVLMPAQIAAGLIIVRTVDGRISALNLEDGSEKWTYKRDVPALTLRGNSVPIIEQSYVFNGLDNGRLVALDLLDGHTVFDTVVATPSGRSELERLVDIDGHSVIKDETLYMASYQGRVISIDVRRGQSNWVRKLSTYSGVELAGNALFISDDKDHIWSLDASNGATLWKTEKLMYRKLTRPVAMKNTLVVADYEGYLHWLSAFDGHFMARIETDGSGVIVPPIIHNGKMYVLTRKGTLSAYSIQSTGKQ